MAVDALLKRRKFEDLVHGEFAFGLDFAFDGDGPRGGTEFFGVFGRLVFVDAEFVKIIVVRDFLERAFFSVVLKGLFARLLNFAPAWTLRDGEMRFKRFLPAKATAPAMPIACRNLRRLK